MIFSASSLMQALFLFTFSFVIFLLLSGLVAAIHRYHLREPDQDLKQSGNFLLVSFMAALGFCLLFSSFVFEFAPLVLTITVVALGVFSLKRLLSHYDFALSYQLPFLKENYGLPLGILLNALICFLIAFLYFGDSSFFAGHFPFWVDRFLGALILFLFTLLFDRGTKETFGVQISFGLLALLIVVSVFTLPLSIIWLDFAFILAGLVLAALYWGLCFTSGQFDKGLTFGVALWLGCMFLELLTRGALYFPLFLLGLACCYFLYPSLRLFISHFQSRVLKN